MPVDLCMHYQVLVCEILLQRWIALRDVTDIQLGRFPPASCCSLTRINGGKMKITATVY